MSEPAEASPFLVNLYIYIYTVTLCVCVSSPCFLVMTLSATSEALHPGSHPEVGIGLTIDWLVVSSHPGTIILYHPIPSVGFHWFPKSKCLDEPSAGLRFQL